jgi:hypothetical protein
LKDTEVKRRDGKTQNIFLASRTNLMHNSKTDKADRLLYCVFDVNYHYMQVL